MFLPVRLTTGAGGETRAVYDRSIELTTRQFAALERQAGDMRVPLTRIAEDLHAQLAAAFATEGATGATGPWTQLSPGYGAWKASHSTAPILVGLRPMNKGTREHPTRPQTYAVSGRMMRELLQPITNPATWRITEHNLLYAPDSDIAGFHEFGTSKMPSRPPFDPTIAFLHSIDRVFVSWIGGLMDAIGLAGPGSRLAA